MRHTMNNTAGARRNRRGSVLLMVVGLLTIVAMLGTSFLLIARLDRKTNTALAATAQVDPLARGLVSEVSAQLLADLHIPPSGGNGPYGGSSTPEDFIDYGDASVDDWLWYSDVTTNHLSDVIGTSTTFADTDGSTTVTPDTQDAMLAGTSVYTPDGDEFRAAIRVMDLSGLMNVNIASHPTASSSSPLPDYNAPVLIDLMNYLAPAGIYTGSGNLNLVRRGTYPTNDLAGMNTNLALRVLSPQGGFAPFAIGDEMYLRWLSDDGVTNIGRLFEATDNSGIALSAIYRRNLTTFNCTRQLVRQPTANWRLRIPMRPGDYTTAPPDLTNSNVRTDLYNLLANNGIPQDVAAHLVANLWAYLDGQDQAKAYDFNPGAGTTYYGVIHQPVISEVYAVGKNKSSAPVELDYELEAIEIYNPYGVDLQHYKVTTSDLASAVSLPSTTDTYVTVFTQQGTPPNAPTGTTVEDSSIDLEGAGGKTVKLYRSATKDGGGSDDILMDSVTITYERPAAVDEETKARTWRDTDSNRERYLVAKENTSSSAGHTLGSGNAIAGTQIGGVDVWEGYAISKKDSTNGVESLGELMSIFLTGPDSTGNSLPSNLAMNYLTYSPTPASGQCRGMANTFAPQIGGTNLPNLSVGCLLAEFFGVIPADQTRLDVDIAGTDYPSRVYGKVNINTATADVLQRLPWPGFVDFNRNGTKDGAEEPNLNIVAADIAAAIINYRNTNGPFLTPGQLAIPLGNYMETTGDLPAMDRADYLRIRDSLYDAVANVVTVRSDVFAVNLCIELNGNRWYYVAVIDRSNCRQDGDTPAVLLFSKVK